MSEYLPSQHFSQLHLEQHSAQKHYQRQPLSQQKHFSRRPEARDLVEIEYGQDLRLPTTPNEVAEFDFDGFNTPVPSDVSEDDSDVNESAIQYARMWGLSTNFASVNPLSLLTSNQLTIENPNMLESFDQELDLFSQSSVVERLTVGKDSMLLLQSVLAPEALPFSISVNDYTSKPPYPKKLELPILQGDHELEIGRFCSDHKPGLEQLANLSMFKGNDLELEISTASSALEDLLSKPAIQLESERLECPRSVLHYMCDIFKDQYSIADAMEALRSGLNPRRV